MHRTHLLAVVANLGGERTQDRAAPQAGVRHGRTEMDGEVPERHRGVVQAGDDEHAVDGVQAAEIDLVRGGGVVDVVALGAGSLAADQAGAGEAEIAPVRLRVVVEDFVPLAPGQGFAERREVQGGVDLGDANAPLVKAELEGRGAGKGGGLFPRKAGDPETLRIACRKKAPPADDLLAMQVGEGENRLQEKGKCGGPCGADRGAHLDLLSDGCMAACQCRAGRNARSDADECRYRTGGAQAPADGRDWRVRKSTAGPGLRRPAPRSR